MTNNLTTKEAVEILVKSLQLDPGYRYGWQANIAMAFVDEFQRSKFLDQVPYCEIHKIANKAADNFLDLLCMDHSNDKRR